MNLTDKIFQIPELTINYEFVEEIAEDQFLKVITIEAGLFEHSIYLVSKDKNLEKAVIEKNALSLSAEELFVGEPEDLCTQILTAGGIWNVDNKLDEAQIELLVKNLGNDSVLKHQNKFGPNFRYLGAKMVLELRQLAFSPAWYALGVLILKNYYKDDFKAGALYEILLQKARRENLFLETKKQASIVDQGRRRGTETTKQNAELKRQSVVEIAVKLYQESGADFGILSDLEKAKEIRETAINLNAELFKWGAKLHGIKYFLEAYEDNKLEIKRLLSETEG